MAWRMLLVFIPSVSEGSSMAGSSGFVIHVPSATNLYSTSVPYGTCVTTCHVPLAVFAIGIAVVHML